MSEEKEHSQTFLLSTLFDAFENSDISEKIVDYAVSQVRNTHIYGRFFSGGKVFS